MAKKEVKYDYNPYFISKVQSQGGINFEENIIKKGDGYEACIHLYDYPTEVEEFWLETIMNIKNTIVTLDIGEEEKRTAVKGIEKSLKEQDSRFSSAREYNEQIIAEDEFQKLIELQKEVLKYGEVVKLIHIRIFVADRTREGIEKKIGDVLKELEDISYKGIVLLNEQEYELKSILDSFDKQKLYPNKRYGKGIPALSLGAGFPFNYINLNDPRGIFLGTSFTGGSILFDLFNKDKKRKSYNAIIAGMSGSGKSTTLKKIIKDNHAVGNFIRIIDKTSEFRALVEEKGGKVVSLDGSSGMINPLQIYPTVIDENSNEVIYDQCYTVHKSKLKMLYRSLAPNCSEDEVKEFGNLLRKFYSQYGIDFERCTEYKANEYPILEELLDYAKKELYSDYDSKIIKKNLTEGRIERLDSIILTLEDMVDDYGKIFNGHSTIDDFRDIQIVSYEVGNLEHLEDRLFQTQVFSALTSLWGQATMHGRRQKKLFEDGEIEEDDVSKFILAIDEAHNYINARNIESVSYVLKMMREDRKYFGSVILASHSIKDYVPQDASTEAVEELKKLFEVTQYKFIMQQDNNTLDAIRRIFGDQLSDSEIDSIPTLEEGQCILSISGMKNISMQIEITEEENKLFKGGL